MSRTGDAPDLVTCIDLGEVTCHLGEDEGDLFVVIGDDEVAIRLELGSGGGHAGERAILGAERLITVLVQFVEAMRERAGLPVPDLPGPAVTDPRTQRSIWPPNAFGHRANEHEPQ